MAVRLETKQDLIHEQKAIQAFCDRYHRFAKKIGGQWEPDFLLYKEDYQLNPSAKPSAIVEVKGIRDTMAKEHSYDSLLVAVRKLMTVDEYIKKTPDLPWKENSMSLILIWAFEDCLCWAEWLKLEGVCVWFERTKERESGEVGSNDKEFCLKYHKSQNSWAFEDHWVPMPDAVRK